METQQNESLFHINPDLVLERQQDKSLSGISKDHVFRYALACAKIPPSSSVLDIACGCGYGSKMIQVMGHRVVGVDIESEAVEFARKHYPGPTYIKADAHKLWRMAADVLVSLETLEHLKNPMALLDSCEVRMVIASTPNAELYKFDPQRFAGDKYPHLRHYTPAEFDRLMENAGFHVSERYCQKSKFEPEIREGTEGIFLTYVCQR